MPISSRRPFVTSAVPLFLALCLSFPAPAATQTPSASIPRLHDGTPDLQGNWTNETLTPLERAEGLPRALSAADAARLAGDREERLSSSVSTGLGTYDAVYYQHGDGLAFIDGELRSSLVTVPDDGRIPPFTAEARRRMEEQRQALARFGDYDHPENLRLSDRCLTSFGSNAGPPMLPNGFYNNNYTIAQNSDHVLIMTEMIHDARIIRLDDPRPLPPQFRPWFGDSRGRWVADTLVVETTNFHPLQQFRGAPNDDMRVVEKFHLADDNTIIYRFTVDDPSVYGEPWGGEVPMRRMDDLLHEYACHEGNYSMSGILQGARAQEETEADGR